MSGLVKICGLRLPEHGVVAAEAGADLIGFNFANSKRRVDPVTARATIEAARRVNPAVRTVGLFVGASLDEIHQVYQVAGFDLIQLHGDVPIVVIEQLPVPAIVAIRAEPGGDRERLSDYAARLTAGPVRQVILDGYHPDLAGGTGVRADWSFAAGLAQRLPLMLAGGLNPENVAEAIATVRPAGVDVASGVERDGVKDPALIRAFITNARRAFAQSISSGTSSQEAP